MRQEILINRKTTELRMQAVENVAFLLMLLGILTVSPLVREAQAYEHITPTPIMGSIQPDWYPPAPKPAPELIPTPTPSISRLASVAINPLEKRTYTDYISLLKQLHNIREFSVEDGYKAAEQASLQVKCTIKYEAGGGRLDHGYPPYDPYILDGPDVENAFNYGIGQLAIDGKLPEFFRLGYTNPFNPYQVVAYMNDAFVRQQTWAWSPMNQGLC